MVPVETSTPLKTISSKYAQRIENNLQYFCLFTFCTNIHSHTYILLLILLYFHITQKKKEAAAANVSSEDEVELLEATLSDNHMVKVRVIVELPHFCNQKKVADDNACDEVSLQRPQKLLKRERSSDQSSNSSTNGWSFGRGLGLMRKDPNATTKDTCLC